MTTDPKREFYSPYMAMGNNPLRIIDPDGGSGQDVILKGKNDSSLTIKAPGDPVIINVNKDFGGNETIDIGLQNIQDLAIGYQGTLSGGISLGYGGSGSALVNSVMFFDETYGGYWYQFAGAEATFDYGVTSSVSIDAEASIFFATRNEGGGFGPHAFEGAYSINSVNLGIDTLLRADVFYQRSVGAQWTVHEVGAILSLDAVTNGVNIFGSTGFGNATLLNKSVPTSQRSWSDIISNHLIFNPLSPLNPL